jgi:hypothetical protein
MTADAPSARWWEDLAPALQWENGVVLTLGQALLGFVSAQLLGVAVECEGRKIIVHFAFSEMDGDVQDDVEDIIGEVEGQLWPEEVTVESCVYVGDTREGWPGRGHRLVFLAKGHGV